MPQGSLPALRLPAKEVVVALISDMDQVREAEQSHSIPMSYGLPGHSLQVQSIHSMLTELVQVCHAKGIYVCTHSTDGQFYNMCVRDAQNQPLTIVQLAKIRGNRLRR